MTVRQLYEWASVSIQAVQFEYSSMEDYKKEAECLQQRFILSRTIPGTRKYHSFIPISNEKVKVAYYSRSNTFREERVTLVHTDLPSIESITGFVTCISEDNWWLACVIEIINADSCVRLTFLNPHGPSNMFKYPVTEDVRTIPIDNILTLVDLRTRSGRVYTLSQEEMKSATGKFKKISVC